MKTLFQRALEWLRGPGPQSLMQLAIRRKKGRTATSRLYVMRIDHPLSREALVGLDKSLQPLRDKYGLDFIVLEPGIQLGRFDDI